MSRGERVILWLAGVMAVALVVVTATVSILLANKSYASDVWRYAVLSMATLAGDDPGCAPLAANRGDDAAWIVICSTKQRQYNGSFIAVQTPTSAGPFLPDGSRATSMTFNIGWLDYNFQTRSSDFEALGTCQGMDWDTHGHHCGFNFEGVTNSLFLGFQDGNIGRPDIPIGTVWTKRLGTQYGKCPDGGECIPVSFGGLTRYIRVTP